MTDWEEGVQDMYLKTVTPEYPTNIRAWQRIFFMLFATVLI